MMSRMSHLTLGHILRKQGKLDEALSMHLSAPQLSPNQASSLTAIAFVYLLKVDLEKVVEFANRSLRLKREDQFTLELAIEEMAERLTVVESPIPNLESSLDDLEPGSEILKAEQNMILWPHMKEKREGSDDSAMTVD